MAKKKKKDQTQFIHYATKKCPFCMMQLKINAEKCDFCGKKVGKVNKLGLAEKPVNWKAYTISIAAWIAFLVYIYWAFFVR